jgi:hypothetical protein
MVTSSRSSATRSAPLLWETAWQGDSIFSGRFARDGIRRRIVVTASGTRSYLNLTLRGGKLTAKPPLRPTA